MADSQHSIKADLWLLFMCVVWGASFPLVKIALNDINPFLFLAIRFLLAGFLIMAVVSFQKGRVSRSQLLRGGLLGIFMFAGILLQTLGLQYTTASNSGFIAGTVVVMVPILVVLIEKKWPRTPVLIGALFALAGLYLLTTPSSSGFNKGDLLSIVSSVAFAFEIVYIEILVRPKESFIIAMIMIMMTGILAAVFTVITGNWAFNLTRSMITGLLFVAVLCTALGFTIQTHWQPRTSAATASVIYTMEPVFAAIFSGLLLNERLTAAALAGGICIIAGMLIAEQKVMILIGIILRLIKRLTA
ncbi:DMT family transporter [bacterium]|nr:DMT family transporter [bacterium]